MAETSKKQATKQEKIYAALRLIREVCLSNKEGGCINCPLCTEKGCKLAEERPQHWRLSDELEEIWRAFK